jgi:hypothetical protein
MIKMNMKRCLMLLPVALLCPTWVLAAPAGPDFQVILDGFEPNQSFTGSPDQGSTPPGGLQPCLGTDCGDEVIIDPLIRLNAGGGSPGVGLDGFTFNANANGAGTFDFLNTSGQTFTTLQISFTLTKDEFNAQLASGVVYTCDGGTYYTSCGFQVVDPPNTDTINVDFSGGPGIPSTSTPEPAQWMFLSLAFAGIVIARRKLRA